MKTLVVYDSAYGNTAKVAEAIGRVAGEKGEAKVVLIKDATPDMLEGVELLVVGSPTQGGTFTKAMQGYLTQQLPIIKGLRVAAFDTRFAEKEHGFGLKILMKVIGYAGPKILSVLSAKGGKKVADAEGFIVTDKEGPLAEGELERAEAWIRSLI